MRPAGQAAGGGAARTLNADRRQLTEEQCRAVAVELRQQGHSYRAIGGALGVSHEQIRKDIQKGSGVNELTPEPVRALGLDGKFYPVRRPRQAPEPERPPAPREPQPAPWDAGAGP